MNLGLTITFDATPQLMEVLRALAKSPSSAQASVAAPAAEKKTSMRAVKDAAPVEQAEEKAPEQTATPSAATIAGGIGIEQIRLVIAEKSQNGKKSEAKKLLTEFGVPNISGLNQEQYDSFYQKAVAL